jgi:hypothetical protein
VPYVTGLLRFARNDDIGSIQTRHALVLQLRLKFALLLVVGFGAAGLVASSPV